MNIIKKRNLRRAKSISRFYKGYLEKGQNVLDIGLGNGLNAAQIRKEHKVNITGIDVIDFNEADIPLKIFDGKNIPFKDNKFDVAMITQTLHHCDEPLKVLKEASRVSKRLVILEDVGVSGIHMIISKWFDWMMNLRHGVNSPGNFRMHEEWLSVFRKMKLKVIVTKKYEENPFYSPMRSRFYVLEKK